MQEIFTEPSSAVSALNHLSTNSATRIKTVTQDKFCQFSQHIVLLTMILA